MVETYNLALFIQSADYYQFRSADWLEIVEWYLTYLGILLHNTVHSFHGTSNIDNTEKIGFRMGGRCRCVYSTLMAQFDFNYWLVDIDDILLVLFSNLI